MPLFEYGTTEIEYLCRRDRRLGAAIQLIGPIRREVNPDLFASLVFQIIGQQITGRAAQTIWKRLYSLAGKITPEQLVALPADALRSCGISEKKAAYILGAANRILDGSFQPDRLVSLSDDEVCRELTKFDGIGVWTAEMLMLFSMQRPNILSFGDLAIQRGMRMLYRHRSIDRILFDKYRRRYTPFGSVASLYLWEIAGGACNLTDPAPRKK